MIVGGLGGTNTAENDSAYRRCMPNKHLRYPCARRDVQDHQIATLFENCGYPFIFFMTQTHRRNYTMRKRTNHHMLLLFPRPRPGQKKSLSVRRVVSLPTVRRAAYFATDQKLREMGNRHDGGEACSLGRTGFHPRRNYSSPRRPSSSRPSSSPRQELHGPSLRSPAPRLTVPLCSRVSRPRSTSRSYNKWQPRVNLDGSAVNDMLPSQFHFGATSSVSGLVPGTSAAVASLWDGPTG